MACEGCDSVRTSSFHRGPGTQLVGILLNKHMAHCPVFPGTLCATKGPLPWSLSTPRGSGGHGKGGGARL